MYSVQLIRLLFRLQLPFLSSWCVDLVVKLCLDPSKQVASRALQVLEEICSDSVNVHALARSILPEPSRTPSHSDTGTDPITPFAFRLLDPRSGTIGYRIFSQILTQSGPFRRLSGTSVAHPRLNTPGERVDESVVSSPQPSPLVTPDCPHPITAPVHWVLEVTKQVTRPPSLHIHRKLSYLSI
ncbi:hypothetical protein FGIG_12496 [Fasciola gigantica]|uniref:Uncharacterized protein n=1 Tax=Fasciola gigantica TaxID=46835 RepID=A0A504YPL9_FASGI|nr:hypothetical protein FGIG_12496 [Fasciola gigantica]